MSSERTTAGTARTLAMARLGAIPNPTGLMLQPVAAIAISLMLMTVEGAAARQPDAGRSSGPVAAVSHDSRMIERAYGQTHPSANRGHRNMARPAHARLRKYAAKERAASPQTIMVRRHDRPGSYFLHGARF